MGRPTIQALVEATEPVPHTVRTADLIGFVTSRNKDEVARIVPRLLGDLAQDTREHGVPISVAVDEDGLLRFGLSEEQRDLILRSLR